MSQAEETHDTLSECEARERLDAEEALVEMQTGRKRKFRMSAKSFFLTYPRCPLTPDDVLLALRCRFSISDYYISQERHAEASQGVGSEYHIHALITMGSKYNITDEHAFDITVGSELYHGHYETCKNYKVCLQYVTKSGRFIHSQSFDFSRFQNFTQRMADFRAWSDAIRPRPPLQYPYTLWGRSLGVGDPSVKRRSIWVVGPPSCGKSYGLFTKLPAISFYLVPLGSKYAFEGYMGERILVYDDHFPKFSEIANICQCYPDGGTYRVPSETRYRPVFWPTVSQEGGVRDIVVLSNLEPAYGEYQEAFLSRFTVLHWGDLFVNNDS